MSPSLPGGALPRGVLRFSKRVRWLYAIANAMRGAA